MGMLEETMEMENTRGRASGTKDDLRAKMADVRAGIDPPRRLELASAVAEQLRSVPAFRDAEAILVYYEQGAEVSTQTLIKTVVEVEGRRVFLPFLQAGRAVVTEWRPSDPIIMAEYFGMMPRYRRAARLEEVGVALVPGLAFDRWGGRLGNGTGTWDRLLHDLASTSRDVPVYGLAFSEQIVDEVPMDEGDVRLDGVVTEIETIQAP
jgi:5-formyltetrahydrofolate cyclo-ligase